MVLSIRGGHSSTARVRVPQRLGYHARLSIRPGRSPSNHAHLAATAQRRTGRRHAPGPVLRPARVPREIFELADSLEVLNLSGNALDSLPDDLGRLHRLKVLFCSANDFDELPAAGGLSGAEHGRLQVQLHRRVPAAALPPALRWLILTDNRIATLPEELGRRPLQKLMLAGNRLEALPESMAACEGLELLRIAANRFQRLPAWLATLPRLAWLAYAGNPLCRSPSAGAGRQRHRCAGLERAEPGRFDRRRSLRHPSRRLAPAGRLDAHGAEAVQGRSDQRWHPRQRDGRLPGGGAMRN